MHEIELGPFLSAAIYTGYLVNAMAHMQGNNSNVTFTTLPETLQVLHCGRFAFCRYSQSPVVDKRLASSPHYSPECWAPKI